MQRGNFAFSTMVGLAAMQILCPLMISRGGMCGHGKRIISQCQSLQPGPGADLWTRKGCLNISGLHRLQDEHNNPSPALVRRLAQMSSWLSVHLSTLQFHDSLVIFNQLSNVSRILLTCLPELVGCKDGSQYAGKESHSLLCEPRPHHLTMLGDFWETDPQVGLPTASPTSPNPHLL